MTVEVYGIKNCDTMKKAFKWLEDHSLEYVFHDYKKADVNEAVLKLALDQHGWEKVLNKRGTTWRKLSQDVQEKMNDKNALTVASENPSLIKRPLIRQGDTITLGFSEDSYMKIFKS